MSSPPTQYSSSFPTVPTSLSTSDHGMRDHYAEQEHTTERSSQHTLQGITPYLGLQARLSQVWINRWTILLLLILVRVLIAIGSLNNDLTTAKVKALSACSSVESMGSAMASMPHYMSQGTNELAAKGVEKAVDGLKTMLLMAITAFEEIFVFVINMMYGTYECLITLAVGTAGHAAIAVAEDVTKFLNETITDVTRALGSAGDTFEKSLNDLLGGFNGLFNKDPPKLDLDGPIEKLKNLKIPTSVQDELDKLDKSIPNFDQVHNATNTVLRMPFELIKKEIKEHLGDFSFNKSAFPVPARKQLSFCSDDDGVNSFFDDLFELSKKAKTVFIVILVIAAILAMVVMGYVEMRRWRTMQDRAQLVSKQSLDPLDVVYIASRPYSSQIGLKASRMFAGEKKQLLVRWLVAYCTSTPALLLLALALAGLLSCLLQYALLSTIRKEVPALTNTVAAFAGKVVDALDVASMEWSNGTNGVILAENKKINDNVFGWVNASTIAVNETLDSFVHETTDLLQDAFGGTVLYDPIKGIFDCLIGLKVEALQKGLTWAHDHAHIDFPLFANDTFSAGASKALASGDSGNDQPGDSFVSDPQSGATDKITAAVFDLTENLMDGIKTETIISTSILCCYLLLCIFGLSRVLFLLFQREKSRAEGGVSYAGDVYRASHDTRRATAVAAQHNGDAPAYTVHSANRQVPIGSSSEKEQQWNSHDPFSDTADSTARDLPDLKTGHNGLSIYGVMDGEKH